VEDKKEEGKREKKKEKKKIVGVEGGWKGARGE